MPKIWGIFLAGPHNKDDTILGPMLGSPYLGKLPVGIAWGPPCGRLSEGLGGDVAVMFSCGSSL